MVHFDTSNVNLLNNGIVTTTNGSVANTFTSRVLVGTATLTSKGTTPIVLETNSLNSNIGITLQGQQAFERKGSIPSPLNSTARELTHILLIKTGSNITTTQSIYNMNFYGSNGSGWNSNSLGITSSAFNLRYYPYGDAWFRLNIPQAGYSTTSDPIQPNTPYILVIRIASDALQLYVNNVLQRTITGYNKAWYGSYDRLRLGATISEAGALTNTGLFKFYDLMYYNRALTTPELTSIYNYFSTKWGVTV